MQSEKREEGGIDLLEPGKVQVFFYERYILSDSLNRDEERRGKDGFLA